MDIVYLLIPLSLVLVFLIGAVFMWAIRNEQFDDLEGPAHRILMDEDAAAVPAINERRPAATAPAAMKGPGRSENLTRV